MANKITYENKVALYNDPSISDKNKVKDTDLNMIKDVVNKNADLIPTNNNQLSNGAGYITKTVNNLDNYYPKYNIYTKDEVNDKDVFLQNQINNKANTSDLNSKIQDLQNQINAINNGIKARYPVGKILITTTDTNPSIWIGFGVWELYGKGRTIVCVDNSQGEFNTSEKTGGEKTHTMTLQELVRHGHPVGYVGYGANGIHAGLPGTSVEPGSFDNRLFVRETGDTKPFNILQPYITAYVWKRVS